MHRDINKNLTAMSIPKIFICIILFFAIQSVFAQTQPTTFTGLCNSSGTRNSRVDGTVAIDIKATNQTQFNADYTAQKIKSNTQSLDKVISNYKRTVENNEVGYTILKGNDLLVKASLMCFSKNAKIPILCDVADAAFDKLEDKFKEQMDKAATLDEAIKSNLSKIGYEI